MSVGAPPLELEYLACRVEGKTAVVALDRPPVNAVHQPMYREIQAVFADPFRLAPDLRAVVLAGRGPHFCAGHDLAEFEAMDPEGARSAMFWVREAFQAVRSCPLPVIGAVHGAALGTGLALAASCDFTVAGESARFGLPEIQAGVAGGAKHLSRIMPQPVVRMMYFTAEPISAQQMHELGGVVRITPDGEVVPAALEIAEAVCRHSPAVLREAKLSLNQAEFLDTARGYQVEQEATIRLAGHPDAKEAVRAVRQKRPPRYGQP